MIGLIRCFSTVYGHAHAQETINQLNALKSDDSDPFYIYYMTRVSSVNDEFVIVGNVTMYDWYNLNLSQDFYAKNLEEVG